MTDSAIVSHLSPLIPKGGVLHAVSSLVELERQWAEKLAQLDQHAAAAQESGFQAGFRSGAEASAAEAFSRLQELSRTGAQRRQTLVNTLEVIIRCVCEEVLGVELLESPDSLCARITRVCKRYGVSGSVVIAVPEHIPERSVEVLLHSLQPLGSQSILIERRPGLEVLTLETEHGHYVLDPSVHLSRVLEYFNRAREQQESPLSTLLRKAFIHTPSASQEVR